MNVERTVKLNIAAEMAGEAAVNRLLKDVATNDELEDLIDLGRYPESVVSPLVTWQAQKVLYERTQRWSRKVSQTPGQRVPTV